MKNKQDIQKTSPIQITIFALFIAYIVAISTLFKDDFQAKPRNLWNVIGVHQESTR